MSSLLGHAAAGLAVCVACNPPGDRRGLRKLPVFMLLSVGADFDYFAVWLAHYHPAPRITHTLVFAAATALAAWLGMRGWKKRNPQRAPPAPLAALLVASLSHPLLDLLVGAHPLPLAWPLADPNVSSPLGLLPSAGRLRIGNFYLWRNLLIELAILVPALAFLVAVARRRPWGALAARTAWLAPAWLLAVVWSLGLSR